MTTKVNDNYASAIPLVGTNLQVFFSNESATNEGQDGGHLLVWYKWTAPAADSVTMSAGQSNDTYMVVRVGNDYGSSAIVAENDNIGSGDYRSQVRFVATAGQTYHIGVGSGLIANNGAIPGNLSLTIATDTARLPAPAWPLYTVPSEATTNTVLVDDALGRAAISGASGTTTGSNAGAGSSVFNYYSIYYEWTAPATGHIQFDLYGSSIRSDINCFLTVYEQGSEGVRAVGRMGAISTSLLAPMATSGTYVTTGAGQAGIVFWAEAGKTYLVGVGSNTNSPTGDRDISFRLNWGEPALRGSPLSNQSRLVKIDKGGVRTETPLPGSTYNGVLYNSVDHQIWVNSLDDTQRVLRLDADTGEVFGRITGNFDLEGRARFHGPSGEAWFASYSAEGDSAGPAYVGFASHGALIATFGTDHDSAFQLSPSGVLWGTTGTNSADGALVSYNRATGAVLQTYPTGWSRPKQIEFDGAGRPWLVMSGGDTDRLVSFDPATGLFTDRLLTPDIYGIAYADDTSAMWIATRGSLQRYSLIAGEVTKTYPADTGDTPWVESYPMAYDPLREVVWLHSNETGNLSGYSTLTGDVYQNTFTNDWDIESLTVVGNVVWGSSYKLVYMVLDDPLAPVNPGWDIINDRDVWLHSFTMAERFTDVTVQYGTALNVAQTQGTTGVVLTGAQSFGMTSSAQTFTVRGAMVEPPSITFAPIIRNVSGTPTFSIAAGSATLTTSGNNAVLPYAGMSSNKVTVRATLDGYTDQITILKLISGSTTITTMLTNEREALLADSLGNVLNYNGASGSFKVYEGALDVTLDCTFSVASNSSSLLASISNIGLYSVVGMPSSVDTATVVFSATYKGTTYSEAFIVSKIKAAPGSSADPLAQTTTDGRRLPVNIQFVITGIAFDNTAASSAMPAGGPVLNDRVTEYNLTAGFSETRFWDGATWRVLNALIDGNLLVTGSVSADALSANAVSAITGNFEQLVADTLAAATITADQIDVTTLRINGTNIDPNAIGTGHVVDNAINVPLLTDGFPGANVGADYDSATLTGAYPGAATGLVTVTIQGSGSPSLGATPEIQIFMDGVKQQARAFNLTGSAISGNTMQVQVPVPAGSHTWFVRFHRQGSNDWTLWSYSVSVLGVMK